MDYSQYTFRDLLNDDSFLESVASPTSESELFWTRLSQNDAKLAFEIDQAKAILKSSYSYQEISPDVQSELFDRINNTILSQPNVQRQSYVKRFSLSIAASLLLAIAGGYYVLNQSSSKESLSFAEMRRKPKLVKSEIQLIKPDGEMTIDGEEADIEYSKKGEVSVTSGNRSGKAGANEDSKTGEAKPTCHQLIVPYAKRTFVTLSDGTKVWVNANTQLVYPTVFGDDKREIYVNGEIYLEVSHDSKRPFIVKTKNMDVRVLGTSFNVSAYEEDNFASVVLVTGKVNVQTTGNREALLSPSEMLLYRDNHLFQGRVNPENYISWHKGSYTFEREQFSAVLAKLSHYYGTELVLEKQSRDFYCSGTLNLKDKLSQLLEGLQTAYPIVAIAKDNQIIIKVESPKRESPMVYK